MKRCFLKCDEACGNMTAERMFRSLFGLGKSWGAVGVIARRFRRTGGFSSVQYAPVNDDLIQRSKPNQHRTVSEIKTILSDHRKSGLLLVAFNQHHQLYIDINVKGKC